MSEEDKNNPMYILGLTIGIVVIGFLFGIGYNISQMMFN